MPKALFNDNVKQMLSVITCAWIHPMILFYMLWSEYNVLSPILVIYVTNFVLFNPTKMLSVIAGAWIRPIIDTVLYVVIRV